MKRISILILIFFPILVRAQLLSVPVYGGTPFKFVTDIDSLHGYHNMKDLGDSLEITSGGAVSILSNKAKYLAPWFYEDPDQGTASYQPKFYADSNVLVFDGSNDVLTVGTGNPSIPPPYSIVVVIKPAKINALQNILGSTVGGWNFRINSTGRILLSAANTSDSLVHYQQLSIDSIYVIIGIFNLANSVIRQNGLVVTGPMNTIGGAYRGLVIGRIGTSTSGYFRGSYYEILAYNKALTTQEINFLEKYYSRKYGIVIANG